MEPQIHRYTVTVRWDGWPAPGNSSYREYTRDHTISADTKASIKGSADPAFLGRPDRWNPEELLIAAASACHKLWYLDLCSRAGIIVRAYADHAEGEMIDGPPGDGKFLGIVLRPSVEIARKSDERAAIDLHRRAHANCYIANSVRFPIKCKPSVTVAANITCDDIR